MKNVLLIIAALFLLFFGVSLPEAKEKKTKKSAPAKKAEPASAATPTVASAPPAPKEWTEVQTDSPTLVRVAYRFVDGHYINIKFQNLSTERTVRIRYQVKWQKSVSGKWVEDVTPEGLTIRLRKQEELVKDVLTRSPNIKDVVIYIEASEVL